MITNRCRLSPKTRYGTAAGELLLLGILLPALAAFAQADPGDPVERSMQFVDKSAKATVLFNAGKFDQALAIFQDLLRTDPNLDEDGYVELSVGDCLVALKRTDEARTVYATAARLHPDLQPQVDRRLTELDLAGPVRDESIDRLRAAAQGNEETRSSANLLLGRALQKRAAAVLAEAVPAFQIAVGPGSALMESGGTKNHVAALEEILKDLQALVDRMETALGTPAEPQSMKIARLDTPAVPKIPKLEWQWQVAQKQKPALNLRIQTDKAGTQQVTADGQPVPLTHAQRLLLERHQQRINEILLDALRQTAKK